MAPPSGRRLLRLLWSPRQRKAPSVLPRPGQTSLGPCAPPPRPTGQDELEAHGTTRSALDPACAMASSLARAAVLRQHPRQEPDAVVPPVRIRAGGDPSRKVKGRPYRDLGFT